MHQHDQGDHNIEGEGAGHFYICPSEPPLVLGDGVDTLVPVLVRCGQTEVLDYMETLLHQVIPCSELCLGDNLNKEDDQGMSGHEDEKSLE